MSHQNPCATNRRELLALTGALALPRRAPAAGLLHTTGLEHLGLTVPDVEKSATLYGRIFDPGIYKEKAGPLRCYVKLGTGYIAIGGKAAAPAKIDHVCALVDNHESGMTATFYRDFFGMETERTKTRVWFNVAATRLGLAAGKRPGVDHFCVKVKGLRRDTPEKLKALGALIEPANEAANDEALLRFRDADGIRVELKE